MATEAGCDVLVFARDRNGDPDRANETAAGTEPAEGVQVSGCVAVKEIESWVLSCTGVLHAESLTDRKAEARRQFGAADLSTLVARIESADVTALPADAVSLRQCLARARAVAEGGA